MRKTGVTAMGYEVPWVDCDVRLPTQTDGDAEERVLCKRMEGDIESMRWYSLQYATRQTHRNAVVKWAGMPSIDGA